MKENKVIKIVQGEKDIVETSSSITDEDLQGDFDYYVAQKILRDMYDIGLISKEEFNKITVLNQEKFSPYLYRLL